MTASKKRDDLISKLTDIDCDNNEETVADFILTREAELKQKIERLQEEKFVTNSERILLVSKIEQLESFIKMNNEFLAKLEDKNLKLEVKIQRIVDPLKAWKKRANDLGHTIPASIDQVLKQAEG